MGKLKVLFHINEVDRWDVAFGNIANLINDVGEDNVDVAVLANGPSVAAYADAEKVEAMKGLSELLAAFCQEHPEVKNIFYETIPPGILLQQIHHGALRNLW